MHLRRINGFKETSLTVAITSLRCPSKENAAMIYPIFFGSVGPFHLMNHGMCFVILTEMGFRGMSFSRMQTYCPSRAMT